MRNNGRVDRRTLIKGALALPLAGTVLAACSEARAEQATLYKNPQCSCCEEYASYLRRDGYEVKVVATHDLSLIKREHNVPNELEGCHTTLVGGYVVEGHVPVAHITRLLKEKPDLIGISLPGMPTGTPGMTGPKQGKFTIYAFGKGGQKVYAID